MSVIATIPVFIVLIIMIIIPFVIGTYVYRDAKRRGMNAVLWCLIAALVPSLIGLIIYMLVRGNYSDLRCPSCNTPVQEQFVICPNCGNKLRPSCPNCAMPVEEDWKMCPRCTTPLPEYHSDIHAAVHMKDRSFWKVLAIVILIPILLIIIMVLSLSASFGGGSCSMAEIRIEDYKEAQESEADYDNVMQWLDSLDLESEHAYALRYDRETDTDTEYFYLLYVPGAGNQTDTSFGQSSSIFGTTFEIELQYTGNSGSFFCLTSSADKAPRLKVILDGEKIPCDVTTVDYNPTTFYIDPGYKELTSIDDPESSAALTLENMTIIKIVDDESVATLEVEYTDLIHNILTYMRQAETLDSDHEIYTSVNCTDYYEIIMEYDSEEYPNAENKTYTTIVFEQNGDYFLYESNPAQEEITFQQTTKEFYQSLEELFE